MQDNADPTEDPFEKASEAKRERVAKNELQRLRNIARNKKVKVPAAGMGVTAVGKGKEALREAANQAKKSTASLGKFQGKLPSKLEKKDAATNATNAGRKRKFEPLVHTGEKERSLKILEQMSNKKPKMDVRRAVGKEIFQQDQEAREERAADRGKKGKGGKKGGKVSLEI